MSAPLGLDLDLAEAPARPTATWRVPSQITELIQHSPLETIYLRICAWFFLFCGFSYYFIIARRFEIGTPALTNHLQVFGLIAVAELCLVFLYTRMSNKIDLGPGLKRLKTKIPDEAAVPVAVDVVQHEVVTGTDEGYMWIEEGTLYFKGLQTVFRINSTDVPPLAVWPRKFRPSIDKGIPPQYVLIPVGERLVRLRLRLLDPFEDSKARRLSNQFNRSLTKWLVEKPAGSLESLLPPLDLHDALRHVTLFRFEGFVAGIGLLLFNLTILLTARLNYTSRDLMGLANATEFAAGLLLSWLAVKLIVAQYRNLKVRHQLALELPKAFSKN